MRTYAIAAPAMLLFALTSPSARGHAIVVYSGRISYQAATLRVKVDLDAHLLEHESRALGERVAPLRLGQLLADSFFVFTEKGDRLVVTGVSFENDAHVVDIVFDVPAGISALALLHVPTDALAAQDRQFQLRWSGMSSDRPNLIRLTSGGNHQVIRVDGRLDEQTPGLDEFAEPVLRVLRARNGLALRIAIDIPCTLMSAWSGLAFDAPVVRGDALDGRAARFEGWIEGNLACADAEGVVGWGLDRVSLVGPDGGVLGESATDRGSVYTTRVRFAVTVDHTRARGPIDITWRGFHQTMMRMAVVAGNQSPTRPADLTPMQNVLRIDGLDMVRTTDTADAGGLNESSRLTGGSER